MPHRERSLFPIFKEKELLTLESDLLPLGPISAPSKLRLDFGKREAIELVVWQSATCYGELGSILYGRLQLILNLDKLS